MDFFLDVAVFCSVIFGIALIIWLFGKLTHHPNRVTGKIVLLTFGLTMVMVLISSWLSPDDTSSSSIESDKTEQVASSSVKKESSSKEQSSSSSSEKNDDANDLLKNMSAKKLKKYNHNLLSSLIEDQGFANDGKDDYNYALYIDSLYYDQAKGLIVKVTDDFTGLTDDEKTAVAQGAQKSAAAQLVIDGQDVGADSAAIATNVHYNGRQIGHSKAFNSADFKWK